MTPKFETKDDEIVYYKKLAEDTQLTLAAWFNEKNVVEEALIQIFLESVKSFLRTCENGGMPQKNTKIVMNAMESYAPLYLGVTVLPVLHEIAKVSGEKVVDVHL